MALNMAMARVAMTELVELGFVVTGFSLGTQASITVQIPTIKGVNPPLQFVPTGFGFNGAFRYITFAAVYRDWAVEWHKRLYPVMAVRTQGTRLRVRHHG
jgi:hypothetical protein